MRQFLLLLLISSAVAFTVPTKNVVVSRIQRNELSLLQMGTTLTEVESKEETKEQEPEASEAVVKVEEEEMTETQSLMAQVKESGVAGVISYALWEMAFWFVSVPVCVFGYASVTGHMPDFSDKDDMAKLGAEAFAFVNFARFAVPLRIGLALGTTPWIKENIVDRFSEGDDDTTEIVVESKEEEEEEIDETIESEMDEVKAEESKLRKLRTKIGRVGGFVKRVWKKEAPPTSTEEKSEKPEESEQ